jgi:AcrR family transcriptional regulator
MPSTKYHHGDLKNALIQAGIEILSHEGVAALSLRKVAQRAGVSHAAPYAHFADKQELIAAISTEGYKKLYEQISAARRQFADDPIRQLVEGAWAYVQFAMTEPDHFKITLSNVVEKESEYPALVAITAKSFQQVVEMVQTCQEAGILKPGPADLVAMTLWGLIHGIATLVLEKQVSHSLLELTELRQMLIFAINQMALVELPT